MAHQNQWQVRELARVVGEFGYDVDVLDYQDGATVLNDKYDLIIDLHPGLHRDTAELMAPSCTRVAYLTGSNPAFSNRAEADRIEGLFQRRGARIEPRRWIRPFTKEDLESQDAVFFVGNPQNLRTYSEFNLRQVFFIRNTGYEFLRNRDWSKKSARNFMYLSSSGQVHRGLDLLLEAFGKNPHLNLYVCAPFREERDFCQVYEGELFHSRNIFPVGKVDIAGSSFKRLLQTCSYILLPSCSEGIAGSVLTGMSAGLIPVVSRECGFGEDEVHHLDRCTVDSLSEAINHYAQKPMDWVRAESLRTMEIVQERYSARNYTESVRLALRQLLRPTAAPVSAGVSASLGKRGHA